MRGRWQVRSIAVLGAVLALGACSTDREVTEPEPLEIDDELLAEAVITAEDVGAAFTEADESIAISDELVPVETACDDGLQDIDPAASADATYTGAGLTVTNQVAHLPGGGANALSRLVNDILEDCAQVVVDDVAVRALPLAFGALTDDTKAIKIEVESPDGTIDEHDYILMHKGDLVSVVRISGPRPNDVAVTDRAVRAAVGNLGALDIST